MTIRDAWQQQNNAGLQQAKDYAIVSICNRAFEQGLKLDDELPTSLLAELEMVIHPNTYTDLIPANEDVKP